MSLLDKFAKKSPTTTSIPQYRPVVASQASDEWATERSQFYDRYFGGDVIVSLETPPQQPPVTVFVYPPFEDRKYTTLITSGISDEPMPIEPGPGVPIEQRRVEIFMRIPAQATQTHSTEVPWQAGVLRLVGRFPFEDGRALAPFKTFGIGEIPGSSILTNCLLLPPFYESDLFRKGLTYLDGTRISFLWLDFITDAEQKVLRDNGSKALMELFKAHHHTPILKVDRPSYV